MSASILDALNVLIWQQTKDGSSERPQHFPAPTWRPGAATEEKPPVKRRTPEELRAHFEELRARAREREGGE